MSGAHFADDRGELNTYMIERGWLARDKTFSVRSWGKYQLLHEQYFH